MEPKNISKLFKSEKKNHKIFILANKKDKFPKKNLSEKSNKLSEKMVYQEIKKSAIELL